jgi:hypothetical protein
MSKRLPTARSSAIQRPAFRLDAYPVRIRHRGCRRSNHIHSQSVHRQGHYPLDLVEEALEADFDLELAFPTKISIESSHVYDTRNSIDNQR